MKKSRVTIVALVIILLGGMISYGALSRAEDPGFVIRVAQIMTIFPGASPERVEMLVTDKLEKVIMEMPELDFVQSESKAGVSVVLVSIKESYKQMRPIWDDLRRKVDRATADLPDNIIGPNVNDEFGDVFGTVIVITGEGFTYAELKDVADEVRDEMLLIEEVAKVDIFGAQEERVFVEYNNARLSELGISPVLLGQILESRNIVLPGGEVTAGYDRIVLEPSGNFETVEQLRRSVISLPGTNEFLFLEDIATIERGYIDPPESKVSASGQPALAIAISVRARRGRPRDRRLRKQPAAGDRRSGPGNALVPGPEDRLGRGEPDPDGHRHDVPRDVATRCRAQQGLSGRLDHLARPACRQRDRHGGVDPYRCSSHRSRR
jgi:multidrug efflux pump subunit AcrB